MFDHDQETSDFVGKTPVEIDRYISDESNFDDETWDEIQKKKRALEELFNKKENDSPLRGGNNWFKA